MPNRNSATKKATSIKTVKPTKSSRTFTSPLEEEVDSTITKTMMTPTVRPHLRKIVIVVLLLFLIAVVAYRSRGVFLAARVNNWPVTKMQLDQELEKRYGKTVLDDMISEQLIRQEASKKGITVSEPEVTAKMEEIKKQLGPSVNINDFLAQRGFTMDDFKKQVEVQILVDKLNAGSVNISDAEITDFIGKNKTNLTATDEAGIKAEALTYLTNQKKSSVIQKWFSDLKAKSKITRYL